MGFFSSIGNVFKSVGNAVSSVAKGVVQFAKSPLGSMLMNVGLSMVTGGMSGLLTKGLSMLGSFGSSIGSLASTFSGFASRFLGPVQSFVSSSGLGSIAGFLGKATKTDDLLSIAGSILDARKRAEQAQPVDETTNEVVDANLSQLFANAQAQLLTEMFDSNQPASAE